MLPRLIDMNKRAVLGVGALALVASFALSACGSSATPKQEPMPTQSVAAPTPSPTPTPEPAAGTRDNPIPIDTLTEYSADSMWNFSVGATNPDATADVLAANQFNTPPADGSVFVLAPFYLTTKPEAPAEGADPWASLSIEYVTPQGNTFGDSNANCGVAPGVDLYSIGTMYGGAESRFNVCLAIPVDGVSGGVWRVASQIDPTASIFLAGAP